MEPRFKKGLSKLNCWNAPPTCSIADGLADLLRSRCFAQVSGAPSGGCVVRKRGVASASLVAHRGVAFSLPQCSPA